MQEHNSQMNSTNAKFEHIILKHLIDNHEYFSKVSPILEKKYFKSQGSQKIYEIIKDYYSSYNGVPTLVEVITKVRSVPDKIVRTQIAEDLITLNNVEPIVNKNFLIDETILYVRDAIFSEAVMLGADGVQKHNEDEKLKAWALMESAFKVSIDSDLGLDYDDIEARINYYQTELYGILTTRFKELNKRLGPGLLPGTLSVILSASGVGKSLLMSSMISDFIQQGKNVLLISMEMSDFEIVKRVDADTLDININDLSNKMSSYTNSVGDLISTADLIRERYTKAKEEGLGTFYTKQYAPGTFSSIMLDNLLDSYENEKGVKFDLVVLDYLGIMKSDRLPFSVGLYNYVKSIAEEVRSVAVKRQIPVLSASQLNRSSIGNLDADNSAVADSIGTVQTADFLCFLLQTEELKERNEIVFKITKNRFNGRTDFFSMNIDYDKMRFNDIPQSTNPDAISQTNAIINTELQRENLAGLDAVKNSLEAAWDV